MFFAREKIGKTRYVSDEGYLICVDVPISRVGTFDYSKDEAGIDGGDVVKVTRAADELFKPSTMASFEGKPLTIGHREFATPENYQKVARGVIKNVRQGKDEKSDLLLADIMICDAEAINLVESGKLSELSIGYEAAVIADSYGMGHHKDILGNHVALVETARCGSICKFGDGKMTISSKILEFIEGARGFLGRGETEKLAEALDDLETAAKADVNEAVQADGDESEKQADIETKDVTDNGEFATVEALEARYKELNDALGALVSRVEALEPVKSEDGEEPAVVLAEDEAEKVFDEAEELTGQEVKRPQGDGKNGKGFTPETLRMVKKNALKNAPGTVKVALGDLRKLHGDSIDFAFETALKLKRSAKNPKPARYADSAAQSKRVDINAINAEFWTKKGA